MVFCLVCRRVATHNINGQPFCNIHAKIVKHIIKTLESKTLRRWVCLGRSIIYKDCIIFEPDEYTRYTEKLAVTASQILNREGYKAQPLLIASYVHGDRYVVGVILQ